MSGTLTSPRGVPRAPGDLVAELRRLAGDAVDVRPPDRLDVPGDGRPVAVVNLDWDADLSDLPAADRAVLPVYGLRGRVVVGPVIRPGRPGCPQCLALRVRAADGPQGVPLGQAAPLRPMSARGGRWLPPGTERLAAAVLRAEAERLATGAPPRGIDAAFAIGPARLNGAWHPAVPHTLCGSPHCRAARRPLPPPLPVLSRPLPATGTGSARRHPAARYAERLEREYLDAWSGITRSAAVGDGAALPSVQVRVPTVWGFDEIAIGRAEDYAGARPAAVLEGLERYAGWHCGGRDPVRFAAFAELDDAVDPRSLLLHPEEAYEKPGFAYTPYTPDTPTGWAEAYSVHTGRRTLMPFHIAYYGAAERPDTGPRFVYENSNGCALGSGVEEALLAALLEVAERDAFLCAWYSGTPLPEIDLGRTTGEARRAVHTVRHRTGRDLRAFRAAGAFGIPVALLVSTSEEPESPATLITAGSGLTVEKALLGAVHEMAAAAPAITVAYRRRRPELERALDAPDLVRHMEDHALVGALPGARPWFSFLLDAPPPDAAPGPAAHRPAGDVAADLAAVLAAARRDGHEVFVVDHTTSELQRLGLNCVKAVVPGTVPMTFGHRHRRLPPPAALTAFRARNGMGTHEFTLEEVRHEPHPFP
ncbi:TOMM precursor leader peptide-binding protein [Streptomyces sp. MUM 203J]|uniref:TOMM precursor leader peptide-binding protein n=1 Tax=Streptomyces sp. MUM 203J TaxID=2791990 RepID=UPI001F038BD0|nr:TOMM precursor leader peptide-binding protein [Streptomyces sp. MUM 203J]MCH0541434.1 TOMM precursor leader peptide-binding protein [Streptomyces sp. MUM 203J]